MKGMQKEEGRMKNEGRAVSPTIGRARHPVRAADQPRRTSKFQTRDAILPLLGDLSCLGSNERNPPEAEARGGPSERERESHWAGVREDNRPISATSVPYKLSKSILEKIWLERLRQKQLLREGKIFFACDSPVVSHDRKLRVLTEELGEVAGAIDQIEILNPLRQPRVELSEPSARAKNNLRDELAQIAAVAIAWLESLQTPASSERGSASRSTPSVTNVLDNPRRPFQRKPRGSQTRAPK